MAAAFPKRFERLRQERRGAGDEETDRPAVAGAERILRKEPRVERRHAHHHGRARQQRAHVVGVELREPQHACAGKQRAMTCDEEPMDVVDRQRVQQHVAARKTPVADERRRVAAEIAVGEHRALGPAGRPRCVEDRRELVRLRDDRVEIRVLARSGAQQRAFAACEREDRRFGTKRSDALRGLGPADDNGRLGVAEEIRELALLITGVERQVNEPRAQAREVECKRLPALVDLDGDAVAALRSGGSQRLRNARRHGVEIFVVDDPPVRDHQAGLLGALGKVGAQQRVEVGIHARWLERRVAVTRDITTIGTPTLPGWIEQRTVPHAPRASETGDDRPLSPAPRSGRSRCTATTGTNLRSSRDGPALELPRPDEVASYSENMRREWDEQTPGAGHCAWCERSGGAAWLFRSITSQSLAHWCT